MLLHVYLHQKNLLSLCAFCRLIIFDLLLHECFFLISSDCLQLLVRCINPIFGTTEQEVLAPVHFFARLSSVLLKITISGVYELNSSFFQVCVIVLNFISSTICETKIL